MMPNCRGRKRLLAEASKLRAERERRLGLSPPTANCRRLKNSAKRRGDARTPGRASVAVLETVVEAPRRRTPAWCFPSPSNCSVFCNEQHRKRPGAGTTQPAMPSAPAAASKSEMSKLDRADPQRRQRSQSRRTSRVGMPAERGAVETSPGWTEPSGL